MRSFALFQQLISLLSFGVLIAQFSLWALVLLMVAGLPMTVKDTAPSRVRRESTHEAP